MEYLKVKDSPYVRDKNSKAILNTDRVALNEYQLKRNVAEKQNKESLDLKNRITKIEDDMQEIKSLLLRLIKNGS